MEVNEEKRKKFMEFAGKRVNNVLHDIQILEPMSRSASYDFTKQDVEEMFCAMQESLNNAKIEFEKKFEEKARNEKKVFTFGCTANTTCASDYANVTNDYLEETCGCPSDTSTSVPETSDYNGTEETVTF